jgi:hypothetical protein
MELIVKVVNILLIHVVSLTKSNLIIIEEAFITAVKSSMSLLPVSLLELAVGEVE